MPHWRPLATATTATVVAALLAIGSTGGHSPFAASASSTAPAAQGLAGETGAPVALAAVDQGLPSPAVGTPPSADATAASSPHATARPANADRPAAAGSGGGGAAGSTGRQASATPRPTSKATTRPTSHPAASPAPTPSPSPLRTPAPTPAPVVQAGALRVGDGDRGPVLSWTQCSSSGFAAYAVVRSLDSEIHYPAEDNDTLVALVSSPTATSLVDTGAPNARVFYAVWCLSRSGSEYQAIWKTPVVAYAP